MLCRSVSIHLLARTILQVAFLTAKATVAWS